jgi:hypothetical protein
MAKIRNFEVTGDEVLTIANLYSLKHIYKNDKKKKRTYRSAGLKLPANRVFWLPRCKASSRSGEWGKFGRFLTPGIAVPSP